MARKVSVKACLTKHEEKVRKLTQRLLERAFPTDYDRLILEFAPKGVLTQLLKLTVEVQKELEDRVDLIKSLQGEPNDDLQETLRLVEAKNNWLQGLLENV